MTANEMKNLSEEELTNLIAQCRNELTRRSIERREELKRNFFKAWKALIDDGGTIFLSGEVLGEPLYPEDVEIE